MLYAHSFRYGYVFAPLHGFDGMFFFLAVSLSWNDVHFYNPDAMKLKDRKVFFVWYETNYRQRFDFQRELLSYCRSDVGVRLIGSLSY
jgi:hypothetical protein